jgi:hypothetical protein
VAHGQTFAIKVERYRFEGSLVTDLTAALQDGSGGGFSPRSHEPFEWTTEEGCSSTSSWSILYGLLRDRRDRGVLFVGSHRHRLRTAAIPERFHLQGELGYAVLDRAPTRVLVRDGAGTTVQDEELGSEPLRRRCNPDESSSLIVMQTKRG